MDFNNKFYLVQSIISTCNQYKIIEIYYILFLSNFLQRTVRNRLLQPSPFAPTAFQQPHILDRVGLRYETQV